MCRGQTNVSLVYFLQNSGRLCWTQFFPIILFHLHAKTQSYGARKMFCFFLLICLQKSALCQSKFLQAFFFSGCHQFYLESSSLSGYFKTAIEFKPQSLLNLMAKSGVGRKGIRIHVFPPAVLGLARPTQRRTARPQTLPISYAIL